MRASLLINCSYGRVETYISYNMYDSSLTYETDFNMISGVPDVYGFLQMSVKMVGSWVCDNSVKQVAKISQKIKLYNHNHRP